TTSPKQSRPMIRTTVPGDERGSALSRLICRKTILVPFVPRQIVLQTGLKFPTQPSTADLVSFQSDERVLKNCRKAIIYRPGHENAFLSKWLKGVRMLTKGINLPPRLAHVQKADDCHPPRPYLPRNAGRIPSPPLAAEHYPP